MAAHRVLVVGAGSIGERHLRCFLATGRARASFVEVQPGTRAAVAERYPDAAAFDSLDAAIGRDFDAAVIATPAPLHIPQALALAGRGVHLLIEKPLSISLDGADTLAALVAERRIVAAVAYVLRTNPALAAMRDAIRSGRFGEPLEVVVTSGQDFAFYRPAYRTTYYARRADGGGAVQDALTHLVNAGEWLVGGADRMVADAAHLRVEGVEVEDTAHVLARHGRVLASYALNQHQAPNETTITVVCERGAARFELHAGRWLACERAPEPWAEQGPAVAADRDAPFVRQAHAFLDAVEGKAALLCPLADGVQTLRANLAILESIDAGRWVSIP